MKKLKLNKQIVIEELNGKITIFSGEESVLISLNETASFIFARIKQNKSLETMINELIECYEIDKESAKEDLLNLIAGLREKSVLE